jgi:hypothetical protein
MRGKTNKMFQITKNKPQLHRVSSMIMIFVVRNDNRIKEKAKEKEKNTNSKSWKTTKDPVERSPLNIPTVISKPTS